MSDTKQKALDFFKSNANIKTVFGTTDGFIFLKQGDARNHAKALNADNPAVETFTRPIVVEVGSLTDPVDSIIGQLTPKEVTEAVKQTLKAGAKDLVQKTPEAKPKLSVAEYKELKEKATIEYKQLFGAEPDSKLSGAKIQELNDAKKAESANQNPK